MEWVSQFFEYQECGMINKELEFIIRAMINSERVADPLAGTEDS